MDVGGVHWPYFRPMASSSSDPGWLDVRSSDRGWRRVQWRPSDGVQSRQSRKLPPSTCAGPSGGRCARVSIVVFFGCQELSSSSLEREVDESVFGPSWFFGDNGRPLAHWQSAPPSPRRDLASGARTAEATEFFTEKAPHTLRWVAPGHEHASSGQGRGARASCVCPWLYACHSSVPRLYLFKKEGLARPRKRCFFKKK